VGVSEPLDPTAEFVRRLLAIIDALCDLLAEQAARDASGAPAALLLTVLRSRLRRFAADGATGLAAAPGARGRRFGSHLSRPTSAFHAQHARRRPAPASAWPAPAAPRPAQRRAHPPGTAPGSFRPSVPRAFARPDCSPRAMT
jgi:hypothetical protein